jgi:hypothetical protein
MQMNNQNIDKAMEVRFEDGRGVTGAAVPALTLEQMINAITLDNCHAEINLGPTQGREVC